METRLYPWPMGGGAYYDYPRIQEFGKYWRESCEMCGRAFWVMRRPSGHEIVPDCAV